MTDPNITSMPCWCWHTPHGANDSLFSWILEFAQQAEQVQMYWHSMLKRLFSITQVSCERGLAFRGKIDNRENGNFLWYARTPCPVGLWQFPKPAQPEARKARKPSLQTMCPQQQRRMLNSILLTSLSVNGYNPVIEQFLMPLAHRPSAYEEMHSKFCFLAHVKFLFQMRTNVWRRNSSLSTKTA